MPCDSSYLDPTARELELHRAATLLLFVAEQQANGQPDNIAEWLRRAVARPANQWDSANPDPVPLLCATIKHLSPWQREYIVYNAHSSLSRDLADWVEAHEAADREREARETKALEQTRLKVQALQKLTPEEREALGLA